MWTCLQRTTPKTAGTGDVWNVLGDILIGKFVLRIWFLVCCLLVLLWDREKFAFLDDQYETPLHWTLDEADDGIFGSF